MANSSLPTNVTAGTPDLPGMLNETHTEVNELSRATGLRDVTGLLANGWTATAVYIERIRDHVYLYWRGLDGTASTSAAFLTFGSGAGNISNRFAPLDGSWQSALHWDDNNEQYRLRGSALNLHTPSQRDLGGYIKMEIYRAASSAWPTTLPGTAV